MACTLFSIRCIIANDVCVLDSGCNSITSMLDVILSTFVQTTYPGRKVTKSFHNFHSMIK